MIAAAPSRRALILAVVVAALAAVAVGAAPAQAEFDDPLFLFRPLRPANAEEPPEPPPVGDFEGPCGVGVSSAGNFFVSDFFHRTIDLFGPAKGYGGQISGIEPLDPEGNPVEKGDEPVDGPCGLSFDAADALYVNVYHRSVVRFSTFPAQAAEGTVITGAPVDTEDPTGVAADPATNDVYVDDRTHVDVFDSSGAHTGTIGAGAIGDGYGLAISGFPATAGRLYVPDASTGTVKVFDPAVSTTAPVAAIDGSATPRGRFVSLRDSAVAVDNATGEVYVADLLQPAFAERPEAAIYVFSSTGAYEGRLKYNIVDAKPPGLAVDNSANPTQGRVYVTTENSERAAVFAYPPHAATAVERPAPALPARQTQGEEGEEEELGGETSQFSPVRVSAEAAATVPAEASPGRSSAARRRQSHRRRAARHRRARRHAHRPAARRGGRG